MATPIRELFKSVVVIGTAQAANSVISLVRMKLLAMLIGPSGLGLFGLYQSLQATASTAAGLGLTTSGVRELAQANGQGDALTRVRAALFVGLLVQGAIAMTLIWLFRDWIAGSLVGKGGSPNDIVLLGLAVLLSLAASSQTSLLQGLRRIPDLIRVTLWSALIGSLVGLTIVWWQRESGVVWFLLLQPMTALIVAHYFIRTLLSERLVPSGNLYGILVEWRNLARHGVPLMLAALLTALTMLLVRSSITDQLGLEMAGLFTAASALSLLYVNFLLQATATDYFPRLSESIGDKVRSNHLINTQVQVSLLLGGSIVIFIVATSPWLLTILYSDAFSPAAEVLQWQSLGNILKLTSLPLSYVLISTHRSGTYFVSEAIWNLLFLGLVWGGLSAFGLAITGVAYFIAYAMHIAFLAVLLRPTGLFRWERSTVALAAVHLGLAAGVMVLVHVEPEVGAIAGVLLSMATAVFALRGMVVRMGPESRISRRIARAFERVRWPIAQPGETSSRTN